MAFFSFNFHTRLYVKAAQYFYRTYCTFISPWILFSHKPVYPIMAVKITQIYEVQVSGKWIYMSKN